MLAPPVVFFPNFIITIPLIRAGKLMRRSVPLTGYIGRVATSRLSTSSRLGVVLPPNAIAQSTSDNDSCCQRSFDVVIIGGGACGVAIATQLARRTREGSPIKSVLLVEKSDVLGPGLAYSDGCTGTLLNVPADTMGLDSGNPQEFWSWIQSNSDDRHGHLYLPRPAYGQYLKALCDKVRRMAIDNNLRWETIRGEAISIQDVDGTYFVTLANNVVICALNVVLSVGNFWKIVYPELRGAPGYLPSPYPTYRLKDIPNHSSVSIIGSGLTAVDAAVFLADSGHRGPITLLSRGGQLPKVQGTPSTFRRSYVFHSLAKTLELSRGSKTLSIVADVLRKELENEIGISEMHQLWFPSDPLSELRADISNATSGPVGYQTVLLGTYSLAERYWHCMSSDEKQNFFQTYFRMWNRCRHTLPLPTARKLLPLMESGQVRVGKIQGVNWSGSGFSVSEDGSNTPSNSDFLIEAAGQEYNPHNVNSPLLRQLLSSGLLQAHPAGGVSVDFTSLAARERFYVIGSMTRGVHFYTNSVPRNLAHAVRISDHISGVGIRRPLHIAFFVNGDLLSQLMLSKLVMRLRQEGHMPFIFVEMDRPRFRSSFKLRELQFFQRELLNDHVVPFRSAWKSFTGEPFLTINEMAYRYGILVHNATTSNSEYTSDLLREHHIDVGIVFGGGLDIHLHNHFASPRVLLRLLLGTMPMSKASLAIFEAINDGHNFIDCTLSCTQGRNRRVVGLERCALNPQKAALNHCEDLHEPCVELVLSVIEQISRYRTPNVSLNHRPSPLQMDNECRTSQTQLLDADGIKGMVTRFFSPVGGTEQLKVLVDATTRSWYLKNGK